ncbi:alpha/beta fold hydrolase [Metabacillus sp. 113a]|uniref:alpha/beta fold hydrolase n=1 Tax=Metabacillus sp. 113a TaxID=3404706 RepID=UPI003CF17F19
MSYSYPSGKTFYQLTGTGKQTIVFIHPTGMGSAVFHYQRVLQKNFAVLTYDLRGNGRSGGLLPALSVRELADDLYELLSLLSISKAIICGYSNGGCIAQEFALAYPDKTEGLLLIGGFPEVSTPLLTLEFKLGIALTGAGGMSCLSKAIARAHAPDPCMKDILERYMMLSDPYGLYKQYQMTFSYTATARLHLLAMPVLLIYGSSDRYLKSYPAIYEQEIPHAKIVYISDAGHQIPTKFPNELNFILKHFIQNYIECSAHLHE